MDSLGSISSIWKLHNLFGGFLYHFKIIILFLSHWNDTDKMLSNTDQTATCVTLKLNSSL